MPATALVDDGDAMLLDGSGSALTDGSSPPMGAVFFPGIRCLPPTITSDGGGATAAVSVAAGEGVDLPITTIEATQAHGGGPIDYTITGGADAALFDLLDLVGDLYFIDPAVDGTYVVEVTATGRGGLSDTQTITVTVGAGEAAPDWVPDGAISFVDFKNGHYYAGGSEQDVDDLFRTDADNAGSVWAPENISPGNGLAIVVDGDGPSFAGDLLSDTIGTAGSTVVFRFIANASGDTISRFTLVLFDTPDFTTFIEAAFQSDDDFINHSSTLEFDYPVDQVESEPTQPTGVITQTGLNIVAVTLTPTKGAYSANGSAALVFNLSGTVPWETVDDIYTSFGHMTYLESITVYPPQLDADLPALSDLGGAFASSSISSNSISGGAI